MKNVSRIIPCYAADTSGVCSALYELGGMTVVHDASGCNSTYSTHDEPRWTRMRSNIFISALTEIDAIMGNDERLISDAVSAAADRRPAFIAVCGSPMPMMTGVDFDAVAAEIESRSGIRTLALHTNGTRSYIEGASEAFEAVIREYAKECPRCGGTGVNILGMTPLDFPLGSDASVRKWLGENGLRYVSNPGMGGSLGEISRAASASVNLVVSEAGAAAARYMKETFGIPYVYGVPYGKRFAAKLAEHLKAVAGGADLPPFVNPSDGFEDADTVVIGESVSAGSLSAALWADLRMLPKPMCTLPSHRFFSRHTGGEISAEEDIEACLADMKPKTVIADPLYKYVVPEGTRLIPLPHFGFSGRCFERDMKALINTDIKEFFE
ncbi:MAG: oxalate:formate antiporter [Ruminococcus sp.]|nr:oxalate:formate antiporter [Ruminococcus sp.]